MDCSNVVLQAERQKVHSQPLPAFALALLFNCRCLLSFHVSSLLRSYQEEEGWGLQSASFHVLVVAAIVIIIIRLAENVLYVRSNVTIAASATAEVWFQILA